ncbi:MAG: hypothetical protein IPL63_18985 [Saprospiraceae bacterium]|nr:hypothetical protein [Saprospiraceae bacterium]MBK6785423.1 hypothetical protein [Saprospiraceae bacterium]MBK7525609.1 hypothetical protein [Saprospiraceae bacterium]MBK8081088.1 hypothetical protein [Saprospiraceae bacterium]MBK8372653.1 hypothetical protein [Saprospiraceae bacterium]
MHSNEYSESNWENQISLFLDNQLSMDEKNNFIQDVQSNPVMQKALKNEQKFREVLKHGIVRPECSLDFEEKLKEKIGV